MAIGEARTEETWVRLVVRFDEPLTALQAARAEGGAVSEPEEPGLTRELLARRPAGAGRGDPGLP